MAVLGATMMGFLDLFVANLSKTTLYHNNATGPLRDRYSPVVTDGGFAGCAWGDYDSLLTSRGESHQPNFLYHNER
jgi:hypothetical protein